MTELVTWLRAQLDEDERAAQRIANAESFHGVDSDAESEVLMFVDMRRLAADTDAKRCIVEACEADLSMRGVGALEGLVDRPTWDVLVYLALPYADRPGYLEEWRPATTRA